MAWQDDAGMGRGTTCLLLFFWLLAITAEKMQDRLDCRNSCHSTLRCFKETAIQSLLDPPPQNRLPRLGNTWQPGRLANTDVSHPESAAQMVDSGQTFWGSQVTGWIATWPRPGSWIERHSGPSHKTVVTTAESHRTLSKNPTPLGLNNRSSARSWHWGLATTAYIFFKWCWKRRRTWKQVERFQQQGASSKIPTHLWCKPYRLTNWCHTDLNGWSPGVEYIVKFDNWISFLCYWKEQQVISSCKNRETDASSGHITRGKEDMENHTRLR